MKPIINNKLQGKIHKRFTGGYTTDKVLWAFLLNIGLHGHVVNIAQAAFFDILNDPTTSFINEISALHLIKTTAISLNIKILNLDKFEPRCYSCTSHVLAEETEGEFVCLTCGESGPRKWFFTGGIQND